MRSEITVNPDGMTPGKPFRDKSALATTLATVAVAIAVAGALVMGILGKIAPQAPVPDQVLTQALPDAVLFEKRPDPLDHFSGLDGKGHNIGVVVSTDNLSPAVQGYLGQVGCAVGLTPDGRITSVSPFRHKETPYYMEIVAGSGLLEQMAGIDMTAPFPDLDAVSGATITSRAIIDDVRHAASEASRQLYAIEVPQPASSSASLIIYWKEILLAATLFFAMAAGLMRDNWFRRYGIGMLTLFVVGVLLNTPLTLSALSRIFQGNLPGTGNPALWLILLFIVISSPLQGRSYCRDVCPFGTCQKLLYSISPFQVRVTPGVNSWLPALRRTFTAVLIVIGVWGGLGGFMEVEPFFYLFSFDLTPILWIVVIFVLSVSTFWRRFWCNTMCPTGTILSLLCRILRPRKGSSDEFI